MKNNKYVKIGLIFCILVEIYFGIRYYYLTKEMINLNTINTNLEKLTRINEKINIYFTKKLNLINYDDTNKLISNFNETLKEIPKNSFIKNILISDLSEKISELQDEFDKKTQRIYEFNALNSQTLVISKKINDVFLALNDPNKFLNIYSSVLRLSYKNIDEIKNINKDIEKMSFNNTQESDFKNLLTTLLGNYIKLSLINNDKNEFVAQKITSLQNEVLECIKDGYYLLRYITIFIFFAFAISLCLIYYLKSKKDENFISYKIYKDTMDKLFCSVCLTDNEFNIKYVNKAFCNITKYNEDEVIGKKTDILKSYRHTDEFYSKIYKNIKNNKIFVCDEVISKDKNGEFIYEKLKAFCIKIEEKILGFAFVNVDLSMHKRLNSQLNKKEIQLQDKSLVDELTSLGNSIALDKILEENKNGIVVYININNFTNLRFFYKTKTINQILLEFSKTLSLCIDTYKINAKAFRLQIDEFCLWYNGDNIKRDIEYIKGYLNNQIFNLRDENLYEIVLSLNTTFGVSSDRDNENSDRIYQATLAHHEARSKNEIVGYYHKNNIIEKRYHENQLMTNTIQYALNNNQVTVECQAVFDISSNELKIKYYEILIRLIDEKGKTRYPGEFLEVAKQTSLYIPLAKVLIEQAFTLIEKFPHTSFSINLSNLDISNQSIRELFIDKISKCKFPQNVCVEILESDEIDDYTFVENFIACIKKYQCKIAIDDFGSGYSNYYRILALDVDYIKIDGSIIKKITTDENSRAVVGAIVDFANKQNYEVVAEFVANQEIFDEVRKLGIKNVQGYFFAKPISPGQIE